MKLSEIFWRAANEFLLSRLETGGYSCWAVSDAVDECELEAIEKYELYDSADGFIKDLGCDSWSMDLFGEFEEGPERQGARYAWLAFASMYAEELGL